MRATVSHIERHGRTVTLHVRITAGTGSVTATAAVGRRRVRLHSVRTGSRTVFTATLSPGRWTLTINYSAFADGLTIEADTA